MLNVPEMTALYESADKLIETFDQTRMMYLDYEGSWVTNPQTLRDRISNELWYTLWEVKQQGYYDCEIKSILSPFIRDNVSWNITCKVYHTLVESRNDIDNLLIIFEVLYSLIEFCTYTRNSELYVADWDLKNKARKTYYLKKSQEFMKKLHQTLGDEKSINDLFKITDALKQQSEGETEKVILLKGIFNQVCIIIAEEEKVRQSINEFLDRLRSVKKKDEIYAIINEEIGSSLGMMTKVPRALLRPCLELIVNRDISVASGFPYEASGILGGLSDLRSTDTLLAALDMYEPKHTIVRCNLIYALSNLKQKKTLNQLLDVLREPDFAEVHLSSGTSGYMQSLNWEKCEAIWALGKLGAEASEAIPVLRDFISSSDNDIKLALAWAVGMIGRDQKEKFGGIDAGIVTILINLLGALDSKIFEEVVFSLRRLGLPDFLHALYLHTVKTIPILSLKPSNAGLYELSESIFHLMSVKRPVIIAVTGDSGTGKTYFCDSITNGFGGVRKDEIAYFMRDNPGHMIEFYRMLGIKLLKELFDPEQFQDYPFTEEEDNPDAFFEKFIERYSNKKLIILDGWMDQSYFYQVIKVFFAKGYLDAIVNFRTTSSSKRLNLEEREGLLENVKTCLSYVEKPMIEETEFYRDCNVLIYNLDNSMPSRLCKEEISEVFSRKKVDTWGDFIRVGQFKDNIRSLTTSEEILSFTNEKISLDSQYFSLTKTSRFVIKEARFSRILNEDGEGEPNLLQTIRCGDLRIKRIVFYTQGQIAFCAYDGSVGILSGLNDEIFYTDAHRVEPIGLSIFEGDICSIDSDGILKITSFERNTTTHVTQPGSPACTLFSDRSGRIVTGHVDGTIRVWDVKSKEVKVIQGHTHALHALVVDRNGRIISSAEDGEVRIWDVEEKRVKVLRGLNAPISVIRLYPDGRLVGGTGLGGAGCELWPSNIKMIDVEANVSKNLYLFGEGVTDAIHVYFDGRLFAGITNCEDDMIFSGLVMIDPRSDFGEFKILNKHSYSVRDCVTMGPRIITCGSKDDSEQTLQIWATESYVIMEREKLKLITEAMTKPSYYRTLF